MIIHLLIFKKGSIKKRESSVILSTVNGSIDVSFLLHICCCVLFSFHLHVSLFFSPPSFRASPFFPHSLPHAGCTKYAGTGYWTEQRVSSARVTGSASFVAPSQSGTISSWHSPSVHCIASHSHFFPLVHFVNDSCTNTPRFLPLEGVKKKW